MRAISFTSFTIIVKTWGAADLGQVERKGGELEHLGPVAKP